ncbi:putative coiled coil-containing protein [Cryptosporidium canis]|uniref:Coiled coil-containing protein n=1 Tax=Cryptosporidium canis TaxID=195482 RepID=A0ABQ8P724_9CRYT|nr:putative coiled coil-containing protein [Cryptosporidium canis]
MSSKIPSLIRPTNLKKPWSASSQMRPDNRQCIGENSKGPNPVKYSKNENKENYNFSGKSNSNDSKNIRLPRVAYLSGKPMNKHSVDGTSHPPKPIAKKSTLNNSSQKASVSKSNFNKIETINGKSLSIRQQRLIKERETRLEDTKLRLKKADYDYSQELLLSRVIDSELKLQLEYLDENNSRYLKEIKEMQDLEGMLECEILSLENQLNAMESALSDLKNIRNIKSSIQDFKIQNLDFDKTIQLISKEISDCEHSIKSYEFEGDNGKLIIENLKIPFNDSVEHALSLEKLLHNDKLLINQLQFRLHKLTRDPKFVCRTYSTEIPHLSKVNISIPSCNGPDIVDNILKEDIQRPNIKNQIKGWCKLRLDVDTINARFSIGTETVKFDKIIEFDETKRPSTLLITDLSRMYEKISHIIMEGTENIPKKIDIGPTNKHNIIRRQSLLHSKIEYDVDHNGVNSHSKNNTDDRNSYYLVDINEQKEVEIDVLLLINDLFNSIKLVFVEKGDSSDNSKTIGCSHHELPPIFIANIGQNSTASRQTFWGTNNARILFVNDGTYDSMVHKQIENFNKKIPGILHSVIYQIYQNMNNSSLFDWKLEATITLQDPIISYTDTNDGMCDIDFREKASNKKDIRTPDVFNNYIFSERGKYYNKFHPDDHGMDEYHDILRITPNERKVQRSNTIKNCEFKRSEDFISQIYAEIQHLSPNLLGSINAYCLSEETLPNISDEFQGSHIIIILKIEAITPNSSISSNIVLTDLFVDDNGAVDDTIVDYLSFIKGSHPSGKLIDEILQLKSNSKADPLVYTLVHSIN